MPTHDDNTINVSNLFDLTGKIVLVTGESYLPRSIQKERSVLYTLRISMIAVNGSKSLRFRV